MKLEQLYLKIYPKLNYFIKIPLIKYRLNEYKHKIIKESILHDFHSIISKYKKLNFNDLIYNEYDQSPIWIFWWQGLENMPEIVKICYASILKNANKHPIHLITKDNISEYTNNSLWDNTTFEWLNNGNIDLAYFSDILRMYLLYIYGGFWIDSTILLIQPLDTFIPHKISFYSGKRLNMSNNYFVPKGKWTSFFIYAKPQNLLTKFIYDILLEEIYKNGKKRDYFMIDYCFVTAYEQFPYVTNLIKKIPTVPNNISSLIPLLNNPFNKKEFTQITKNNPFFKLTYKEEYKESDSNKNDTYFKY